MGLSPGDLGSRDAARDVDEFLRRCAEAVRGGLGAILLREPLLDERAWIGAARGLLALHREALDPVPGTPSLWVGGHDRAHLAASLELDAVHLGFRSLPPAEVRSLASRTGRASLAIGLSTHEDDDPRAWSRADYVFHGPVRETPSKRGWRRPIGIEGLARAVGSTDRPVLAIGGLRAADAREVRACGARGLVVRGGILAADDPRAAARRYLEALCKSAP